MPNCWTTTCGGSACTPPPKKYSMPYTTTPVCLPTHQYSLLRSWFAKCILEEITLLPDAIKLFAKEGLTQAPCHATTDTRVVSVPVMKQVGCWHLAECSHLMSYTRNVTSYLGALASLSPFPFPFPLPVVDPASAMTQDPAE